MKWNKNKMIIYKGVKWIKNKNNKWWKTLRKKMEQSIMCSGANEYTSKTGETLSYSEMREMYG